MTDSRRGGKSTVLEDFSGGLRCDVPSHMISENELSDIQNFDVDSPGKLVTRKGYTRVSSAGIAAATVRGVYEHTERSGRRHIIAACDGHLWKFNERDRTWTQIYKESSAAAIFGANLQPNGNLATNTTGWTLTNNGTNTTVARDATHGPSGGPCLKIMTTTPAELISNYTLAYSRGTPPVVNDTTWTDWWRDYDPPGAEMDGLSGYGINVVFWMRLGTTGELGDAIQTYLTGLSDADRYRATLEAFGTIPATNFFFALVCRNSTGGNVYNPDISIPWTFGNTVWTRESIIVDGPTYPGLDNMYFTVEATGMTVPINQAGMFRFPSVTARPRFDDGALSPATAVIPSNRREIFFNIKRSSGISYANIDLKVYANYYSDTSCATLISTVELAHPTTTTTYSTVTVNQAQNTIPATAIRMKIQFVPTGYVDLYDSTAAGHGWYVDSIEVREIDDSSAVITPLTVNEKVNPTFVSFLGNLYVYGYEQNLKISQAKAVEFMPEIPSSGKFGVVHQNRMFVAGDPENPSRLYFTDYTQGNEIDPDVIVWSSTIDFDPDDGDAITGISPCGSGIVVFKHRSTFMLTGSNSMDFYVRKVSSAVGCASHRSIVGHQGMVIFLDTMNPGVFMYDGSVNFTMLSRKIDPLIGRIVNPERSCAIIKDERYYLFCDDQDAVDPYDETVYVYSLKTGAWTKYRGINVESVCRRSDGSLLAGASAPTGKVYRLLTGYSDDGDDIEAYMVTGDTQFRNAAGESRIRKVSVISETGTDEQELEISYASDRYYNMKDAAPMSLAAKGRTDGNGRYIDKWNVGGWWEGTP